jgi:hypothetical protein
MSSSFVLEMYFAYGILNCARNLACLLLIYICKTQKKGNSPLLGFLASH